MKIRTVSAFVSLHQQDGIGPAMQQAKELLTAAQKAFIHAKYEVQTLRILTNSFEASLCSKLAAKHQRKHFACAGMAAIAVPNNTR